MIFSELYSAYYHTVARILQSAIDHPLQKKELREMIEQTAFGESILKMESSLDEERWQLIDSDGSTPIKNRPTMPLTILQKRWLKAIFSDPRIRLFSDKFPEYEDVEPLFTRQDYSIFDQYGDGDPYEDESYIRNFRLILDAIKVGYPLDIETVHPFGPVTHLILMPQVLEYSEKNDKFRLIGASEQYVSTVNLGRIRSCARYTGSFEATPKGVRSDQRKIVEIELLDQRNALERVLLSFAYFEKEAIRLDDQHYRVKITYDADDEAEMVIQILSFGPMIQVVSPQNFVQLIKERLLRQKSCEL